MQVERPVPGTSGVHTRRSAPETGTDVTYFLFLWRPLSLRTYPWVPRDAKRIVHTPCIWELSTCRNPARQRYASILSMVSFLSRNHVFTPCSPPSPYRPSVCPPRYSGGTIVTYTWCLIAHQKPVRLVSHHPSRTDDAGGGQKGEGADGK